MAVTRQEVERELDRKSASIAGSISRLKSDLSLPVEPVRSAVRKHPVEVVVGTVVLGLAIGWLVAGRSRKTKGPDARARRPSPDMETSEFVHLVQAGRAAGLNDEEAVERALRAKSIFSEGSIAVPRQTLSQRLSDHLIDLAETIVRSALRVVAREATGWVAEMVRRDRSTESQ